QSGRRYEMAAGGLYQAIQHSPQVLRPRLCRALQGADRGWQWQRPPQNGLRLRASQSSESQIDPAGSGTGDFPVEQLWRVSQAGGENVGPGCGRTGCWASTGRSDAFYSLGARSRSAIAAPEEGRTPPWQSPHAVDD